MANVKFPKKEIEKYIKLDEKTLELIPLFGTPVESITDDEIELEIFPNRPDLLSMHGWLRGFLGFIGKKVGLREYKLEKPEKDFVVNVDKSVLEVRPYTACAIVKGLSFNDEKIKEVIDIQEKIHNTLGRNRKKIAIGIYPLEKIKLPIKYEARAPNDIKFVPLEAHAEMTGRQILTSHPTGRDYAHLLADKKVYPVFVDSNNEILSMPPIINSHKTGKIEESTKEIFIECSGFDLSILKKTLNILVTMFADLGGKVYQMEVKHKKGNYITPDISTEKMQLSFDNCNKLLGLKLNEKEIMKYLEKMGYAAKKIKSSIEVEVPSWRTDVLHENDLIEDVAIGYGYHNFVPEIPNISFVGKESSKEIFKKKISEILQGLEMLELSNFHLTTIQDQFKILGKKKEGVIELEDSKTEYNILRQDLLHYGLKIFRQNVDSEYPQRVFELGRVFRLDESKEVGIKEEEHLAIEIASQTTGFTEIKQILDLLMRQIGVEYKLEEADNTYFIEGRCARVIVNRNGEKELGFIGEVHPRILNNLKIKMPVVGMEFDLEWLF